MALAAVDGWGRKEEVVVGSVDGGGGGGGGCMQIRLSVAQQRSPTRVTGNQRVGNCRAEPMTCTPQILPYPYPHSLSRLYY
jgi:hypothetical protein